MTAPEFTLADIEAALVKVTGKGFIESAPMHPMQWEAEQRVMEAAEVERWWAGFATPREMDGAAADAWYGRAGS